MRESIGLLKSDKGQVALHSCCWHLATACLALPEEIKYRWIVHNASAFPPLSAFGMLLQEFPGADLLHQMQFPKYELSRTHHVFRHTWADLGYQTIDVRNQTIDVLECWTSKPLNRLDSPIHYVRNCLECIPQSRTAWNLKSGESGLLQAIARRKAAEQSVTDRLSCRAPPTCRILMRIHFCAEHRRIKAQMVLFRKKTHQITSSHQNNARKRILKKGL